MQTQQLWCYEEGQPLRVLAISAYNVTSDGNSIGFVRDGNSFQDTVFEFNHELGYKGDDPSFWATKISDCLADFVIDYLERVA